MHLTSASSQPTAIQTSSQTVQQAQSSISAILQQVNSIVLDKAQVVKLTLTAVLAGGHVLFEDLPGMGKTTLALSLAKTLGLSFSRVQMTNDLLPADIIGSTIFNAKNEQFSFIKGAIFNQLLLADELNRTSAKTQSALLEAMEEQQVTVEGISHALPAPFMVIATQNSQDQAGTNILPESQLDRFMMRLSLGFPSVHAELNIIKGLQSRDLLAKLSPVTDSQTLLQWQDAVKSVFLSDDVATYIQRLAAQTRQHKQRYGLSTRGVLALVQAAKAYAFIEGRHYVVPEDVQQVFAAVVLHRMGYKMATYNPTQDDDVLQILNHVSVFV